MNNEQLKLLLTINKTYGKYAPSPIQQENERILGNKIFNDYMNARAEKYGTPIYIDSDTVIIQK